MKKILSQLFEHKKLDRQQAREVLIDIANNAYNDAQVAAFITVYLMRSISPEELKGFREALLEMCIAVNFEEEVIDLCGTGGDGKNTFNISTLASFVVAGAGYKVAKHGNYGVSSLSGSSNVLEQMGYQFTNDQSILKRQLDKAGICFMHAPLFHPALKTVGPIRKNLGVKTFFNMLGPLVNPARPTHQLTGVFNLQLMRNYQYLLLESHKAFAIVYSLDGYDELSLTSDAKVISHCGEQLISPTHFGMAYTDQAAISGGDTLADSASIFQKVLTNEGTEAQVNVVLANASLAIQCFEQDRSLDQCVAIARESLESGEALQKLKTLLTIK